jgi:aminopeptidase N
MSPVLKGTMEIRVKLSVPPSGAPAAASASGVAKSASGGTTRAETRPAGSVPPIVFDWRKIKGHEEKSTASNVSVNGKPVSTSDAFTRSAGGTAKAVTLRYAEHNEHLIFRDGVVAGENVIKLDFTSPILTSGSAITRYVDKEDGSEYLYSLFVPSDASTAFPVFDQPDLKAKFQLIVRAPKEWHVVSNARVSAAQDYMNVDRTKEAINHIFPPTEPISSYVFAFAAGPFSGTIPDGSFSSKAVLNILYPDDPTTKADRDSLSAPTRIYVRKSQAAKFKPHAAEVFRLNREAVKYFEQYFGYKFPFPKYDLVLIPEFPFGGMEHAGATFLRESSIIFPQEPTKNDHISRATLIFHEAAHQWFGDTVTMRWFDDLWLKEGFATFMGYKALEKIMPEMNAWKVFYERVKQGAYQTDSTKGTTPIYQEIKNLSAAKSAYGAIVYNKAPAFLRQAEFYLGEDKFQAAVRAFLKKHEYANAGWEDLVKEFESASNAGLESWARQWVTQRGLPIFRSKQVRKGNRIEIEVQPEDAFREGRVWSLKTKTVIRDPEMELDYDPTIAFKSSDKVMTGWSKELERTHGEHIPFQFVFPNYQDYGYGIFLLDEKSRDYVLKNIQNEKDPFLRSMMWGALWDSVREGELDPREYVELVVKVLSKSDAFTRSTAGTSEAVTLTDDESTVALLLNRVGTAMNYYLSSSVQKPDREGGRNSQRPDYALADAQASALQTRLENILVERMQNAPTLGQRITFYRALLNVASSENARNVLKRMLKGGNPSDSEGVSSPANKNTLPIGRVSASGSENARVTIPIKTKDKFDIVTRLLILNDPEAPKLLAELEKTETSDDAKRYAYAAKAGIPTAENKAKYWNDFTNNKEISESWIEAAFGPWNSIRHSELTLGYLQKALQELPNHKRNRKIFFVNGWLGAFIGGQRSEEALAIVNKFLADNPNLDNDLRLKILENVDLIERAVRIRQKHDR